MRTHTHPTRPAAPVAARTGTTDAATAMGGLRGALALALLLSLAGRPAAAQVIAQIGSEFRMRPPRTAKGLT